MSSVLRFDEWQDSEGNTVYDGAIGGLIVPGLVAVKSALKTDTQVNAGVASQAVVDVSGLSISHAVSDASNKVLIMANVSGWIDGPENITLVVKANGTLLDVADTAGSRTSMVSTNYSGNGNYPNSVFNVLEYSPGSTSSVTYQVSVIVNRASSSTVYINRGSVDGDNEISARTISTLTIQEVAV